MCMATMTDKLGDVMGFIVDPLDQGYGDKLKDKTTGKISSKLSETGQGLGFGSTPAAQAQTRQDLQQTETRAARQGSALLS